MTEFEFQMMGKIDEMIEVLAGQDSVTTATVSAVLAGIVVYIISEIIKACSIVPQSDYRKLKEKVEFTMVAYANVYHNPEIYGVSNVLDRNDLYNEASKALRECAAEVQTFSGRIVFPRISIPKKEELKKVARNLIGLSNSVYVPQSTYQRHIDFAEQREAVICSIMSIEIK